MKVGGSVRCPHCAADAFLVKKPVMDGWTKLGDILACSSCGAKIADVEESGKGCPAAAAGGTESLDKLAAFLGTERVRKTRIEASEEERRFCRDCRHLVTHAFLNRCGLHEKEVNPMDDCPDFERKTSKG